MPNALVNHKSFLTRLLVAAVVVEVVFAITDYLAYFSSGISVQMYQLFQSLFPLSAVLAVLLASYLLVCRFVTPPRWRMVATLMILVTSLLYGLVLGVVFFIAQLLPISWLNGPVWPNQGLLGMSLAAVIGLYVFPALAFALASVTIMSAVNKRRPIHKKRRSRKAS